MSAPTAQDSTPSVITPTYYGAGDLEKAARIQRVITPGGHPADFSQPGIPQQHRRVGNPMPAGLLSFASLFLLFGLYGLGAHHVRHPNVVVPLLVFYGGVCQNLIGWFEMFIGNTFSATIFLTFGSFALSYACCLIPTFGVIAAFTDPATGKPTEELEYAIGIFLIVWACIMVLFILAALRSSVAIVSCLSAAFFAFLLIGCGDLTANKHVSKAGYGFCFVAAACGIWAAMAGYWTPDTTLSWIRVSPIPLSKDE
ncbi:ammonium permease ATO2-like protein [Vanrija pseudolonga]|uniref:Meiotically up-regulated gene 86 protein n=1 Tax=Vanrija pseudolonga TaxID=143232 RepID=A0AAF0YK14_9TREE|nr:Meiotically up-regulated gene 86 protein [Vanrija pseudolonga]